MTAIGLPNITVIDQLNDTPLLHGGDNHRWELPGNYPIFTAVMVIYHCVDRIWRILITPNFLYNIYDHE